MKKRRCGDIKATQGLPRTGGETRGSRGKALRLLKDIAVLGRHTPTSRERTPHQLLPLGNTLRSEPKPRLHNRAIN